MPCLCCLVHRADEGIKPRLKALNGGNEHWLHHSCAASCGEVAACLVRVPTAVVTQRMQVGQYKTFPEAVSKIFAEAGVSTFFIGYWTTVAREIPFSFIQFPMYEGLKKIWSFAQSKETSPTQGAICGSFSGAVAAAATCPLDVVKTRMMLGSKTQAGTHPQAPHKRQTSPQASSRALTTSHYLVRTHTPITTTTRIRPSAHTLIITITRIRPYAGELYVGTFNSLTTIAKEEGWSALFSGLGPRVGWITLGGFVFFGAYEKAQEMLWKTGTWGAKPEKKFTV